MPICKGCGVTIVWAEDGTGKKHPLDPRPPIYIRVRQDAGGDLIVRRAIEGEAMVSHFVTCPERDRFSSSKRPKPAAPPRG